MTDTYCPAGPYYLTLLYENTDAGADDTLLTAIVDGFENEADAWRACKGLGSQTLSAIGENGEECSLEGTAVLHVLIAKTAAADFPKAFAAA
jgi:hypothetical protein